MILLMIVMSGLALAASELTVEALRTQERHLALADFKAIYKERQSINKQLLQSVKYNRSKTLQHNTIFTNAYKQMQSIKAQSGSMNNAGAFHGEGVPMPANSAVTQQPTQNSGSSMSETTGHRPQNNLWGKRP